MSVRHLVLRRRVKPGSTGQRRHPGATTLARLKGAAAGAPADRWLVDRRLATLTYRITAQLGAFRTTVSETNWQLVVSRSAARSSSSQPDIAMQPSFLPSSVPHQAADLSGNVVDQLVFSRRSKCRRCQDNEAPDNARATPTSSSSRGLQHPQREMSGRHGGRHLRGSACRSGCQCR